MASYKSEYKIEIQNLEKSFSGKSILQGIDLQIKPGEAFVIIGGSGTGKSVLIKNIALLLAPDLGSILIDGQNILTASKADQSKYISKIGYLFQAGALFDSLNIWENISFRLLQNKISRSIAKEEALARLKSVGLEARIADLYPSELSGGMQKRVALARAVITKPEIIFFDEPTTGLDPIMSEAIDNLILSHTKELGATTITITHDLATVQKIADKVAMLHEGKLIWQGDKHDLLTSSNPILQKFVSSRKAEN